ncbi:MAG TPA: hypothetical protein VFY93_16685 [Planctomycetota bacterium]|nr:hypothetical protein [Planctomycetota bacterium]
MQPPGPPTIDELQEEFRAKQERDLARAHAREKARRRNGTIAGAAAGLAAVAVTAGATRTALFWHSFLLEAVLGAVAGYVLARTGGGLLKGIVLFSGAYMLAFFLRASGLDPAAVFQAGDIRAAPAVQGHFTSLCFLVSAGAAMGHIVADR